MARGHCVDLIVTYRGIRQEWLARELGISDAYLSRLLSGERNWTNALKDEVARLLMIPRQVLFFEDDCRLRLQNLCPATTSEATA